MTYPARIGLGLAAAVALAAATTGPSAAQTTTTTATEAAEAQSVAAATSAATTALSSAAAAAGTAAAADTQVAAAPTAAETTTAPGDWGDRWANVNILSFSDFHGHLEPTDPPLDEQVDPSQTPVGGAEHLAGHIDKRRTANSVVVSAGDNIGGSTFLSGLFHDEPTMEILDSMGVAASAVGNHEFDEGTNELLRMQHGGAHWKDGTYVPGEPYAGADMQYLAANVYNTKNGRRILPGTSVQEVNGVKVGFIGLVTPETTSLVSPGGISSIRFDEMAKRANYAASWLRHAKGVETIVVLVHEGGDQDGGLNDCDNLSGPITELNDGMSSLIDGVVTGHTHASFSCTLKDWRGGERPVVASGDWGRAFNQMKFIVDRRTGDVVKRYSSARNYLTTRDVSDDEVAGIVQKWSDLAGERRAEVVGTVAEDVTGDASGDRGIETPMANLVADSILWGTRDPEDGGADVAFMNVGGVRSSFLRSQVSNGEEVGEITYEEAYRVAPFGNLLVTVDMTGAQIKEVLEQQYDPERGRQYLALGVSDGFTYTWDDSQPQGSKVSGMELDGQPVEDGTTYRVATLSFLQQGGDSFTAFEQGTNLLGGPEDLENLIGYLSTHERLTPPADRVSGL